jgi:RimJ/RimL family protein N-acetyltransferase
MQTAPTTFVPTSAATLLAAPREMSTARLVLRAPSLEFMAQRMESIRVSDADYGFIAWWRKAADEAVMLRSTESEIRSVAAGEELVYHAFLVNDASYVGRLDLHSWDHSVPRCELGYMGDSRQARKGLMQEAATACLQLAFALGCERVQAVTDTRNIASIHFAHRLGFEREGVLRNYERDASEALCDQLMLSIVRPQQALV